MKTGDTFTGTLEIVGTTWGRRFRVRDTETGETFHIFPTELIDLLKGVGFEGTWRVTNRGGCPGVKYVKEDR